MNLINIYMHTTKCTTPLDNGTLLIMVLYIARLQEFIASVVIFAMHQQDVEYLIANKWFHSVPVSMQFLILCWQSVFSGCTNSYESQSYTQKCATVCNAHVLHLCMYHE